MAATRMGRGGWAGQSAVEFALSSLLLLAMFFGTIDLGRVVLARTMLTNAVREAARQGALTPGDTAAMAAAANARSPMLALAAADLTVSCADWSGNARACASGSASPPSVKPLDRLTVCTSYTFALVATGLIGIDRITATECERAHVQ